MRRKVRYSGGCNASPTIIAKYLAACKSLCRFTSEEAEHTTWTCVDPLRADACPRRCVAMMDKSLRYRAKGIWTGPIRHSSKIWNSQRERLKDASCLLRDEKGKT